MNAEPPYESVRNPHLPWGYWLISTEEYDGREFLDEDGRVWSSVREALWVGRLGMPPVHIVTMNESLEFLSSVLAILDRRIIGIEERAYDVFANDWGGSRFYALWLSSQGLIDQRSNNSVSLEGPLSPEGRAILVALASTRSAKDAPLPLGLRWIKAREGLDHGFDKEAVQDLVSRQETYARSLEYSFSRCELAGEPAVKFVGPDIRPNIPYRSTIWSMVFPDEYARDRFYIWCHERIDMWESWGEIARRHGASSLSSHFLNLRFCDEEISF